MATVIFLHGFCGSTNTFQYIKGHFPHAVTFDLPGFGDEEKPRVRYDKELYLLFLEKKITKKSVLVGYSMGAILAKEFAIANPELVEKLILIGYPMHKDHKSLIEAYRKDWLYRQYVDVTLLSMLLCYLHSVYRGPILAATLLFQRRNYLPRRDWFKHTYYTALSSLHNTVLSDDWRDLKKLKDKVVLIFGQRDPLVDQNLAVQFKHHVIPKMKHSIFDFDREITEIIQKELKK